MLSVHTYGWNQSKWTFSMLITQGGGNGLPRVSHALSLEWPETPISLISLATSRLKSGQYWPKSNHFYSWSGNISMPHFGPFFQCVLLGMFGNLTLMDAFNYIHWPIDANFVPIWLCRQGQKVDRRRYGQVTDGSAPDKLHWLCQQPS